TRVVMLTARDDAESRAFASAVGATAYIVKPFGPLDLVRMLRLVLDQPTSDPGLGLFLVDAGVIQPAQLERALAEQRLRQGERVPIGAILTELGFADRADIDRAVERQRRARDVPSRAAPAQRRIRLVIADDNPMVREGLRSAITTSDDLVTVGVAANGTEALRLVRDLDPDVIVLDHRMPGQLGLDVAERLRADSDTAVVMFTLDEGIRELALASGVAAFVPKDTPLATLLAEIRRVARPAAPAPASAETAWDGSRWCASAPDSERCEFCAVVSIRMAGDSARSRRSRWRWPRVPPPTCCAFSPRARWRSCPAMRRFSTPSFRPVVSSSSRRPAARERSSVSARRPASSCVRKHSGTPPS